MLATVGFRLEAPTAFSFLQHLLRAVGAEERSREGRLALYLAERAQQEYGLMRHSPSALAAAALNLALRATRGPLSWTEAAERASGLSRSDAALAALVAELRGVVEAGAEQARQQAQREERAAAAAPAAMGEANAKTDKYVAVATATAAVAAATAAGTAAKAVAPAPPMCLRAVFRKFSAPRYLEVALLPLA